MQFMGSAQSISPPGGAPCGSPFRPRSKIDESFSLCFLCLYAVAVIARWDAPLDVGPQDDHIRLRLAAERHGLHNSYYLSNGYCEFHLTNDAEVGLLAFRFHGTVLTDPRDQRTHSLDLSVDLSGAVCDWLTAAALEWFRATVVQAVRIEFDRYIASSDRAQRGNASNTLRRRWWTAAGLSGWAFDHTGREQVTLRARMRKLGVTRMQFLEDVDGEWGRSQPAERRSNVAWPIIWRNPQRHGGTHGT